jgi:hypothetical protein
MTLISHFDSLRWLMSRPKRFCTKLFSMFCGLLQNMLEDIQFNWHSLFSNYHEWPTDQVQILNCQFRVQWCHSNNSMIQLVRERINILLSCAWNAWIPTERKLIDVAFIYNDKTTSPAFKIGVLFIEIFNLDFESWFATRSTLLHFELWN